MLHAFVYVRERVHVCVHVCVCVCVCMCVYLSACVNVLQSDLQSIKEQVELLCILLKDACRLSGCAAGIKPDHQTSPSRSA